MPSVEHFLRWPFRLVLLLLLPAVRGLAQTVDPPRVQGVYGHPGPLWSEGYALPDLGVNAIFVRSGSIDSAMMERARDEGVRVYAEFATLNGKGYVEDHPEAWPIDARGQRVEPASWFMGVCPTDPGFRAYRFGQLRDLLTRFDLDGVWMDYVHWHAQFEEPEPILPETCFCDHCLQRFAADADLNIPSGATGDKARFILDRHEKAWRDWRCGIILEWAREIKKILKGFRPEALLGLYHAPWTDVEFGGARRRILGLDYDQLQDVVDVFSPMVYHERMGRPPAWVEGHVRWLCERLGVKPHTYPKVWPIVQAHNSPGQVAPSAFAEVLRGGLSACSGGVMMFTTRALTDPGKLPVLREVYGAN